MSLADFPALLERVEQGTTTDGDVRALRRLAEATPAHATVHVALARACELEGRWAEARHSWERAVLLLPDSPAVRAGLERTASPQGGARKEGPVEEAPDEAAPVEPAIDEPAIDEPAIDEPAIDEPAAEEERPGATVEKEEKEGAPPVFESAVLQELASRGGNEALPKGSLETGAHDDLDSLIDELEGARIEPTPNPDEVPAPNLDTGDSDMVSPTLARIYQAQKQYAEAARVYRRLAEKHPDQAEEHRRQAEAMQARAEEERERNPQGEPRTRE